MTKTWLTFIFILIFRIGYGQEYGYSFTEGWKSYLPFQQASDKSVVTIGLDNRDSLPDGNHFLVSSIFDSKLNILQIERHLPQNTNEVHSLNSAFASEYTDSSIIVGGVYRDGNSDTTFAAFYELTKDSIRITKQNLGYLAFILDIVSYDNNLYGLGVVRLIHEGNQKLRGFITTKDSQLNWLYHCPSYQTQGGCNVEPRQLHPINDGFIISGETFASYEPEIRDPLIMKIDTRGNEVWRLDFNNDSTSAFNVVTAPIANGNYIAVYCDYFWKPYKKPPDYDRPLPSLNDSSMLWITEFDVDGNIIKTRSLKNELRFIGNEYKFSFANYIHSNTDGSIIVAGNTKDNGEKGFLLKLDKNGDFVWYRLVNINIWNGGFDEKFFINGLTPLSDGGYVLAGEYQSNSSDTFPNGFQSGAIVLVDEFGCQEPNCQLTDNIIPIAPNREVSIYPNPSKREITIESHHQGVGHLSIFDDLGKLVYENHDLKSGKTKVNIEIAGVYYISISYNHHTLNSRLIILPN